MIAHTATASRLANAMIVAIIVLFALLDGSSAALDGVNVSPMFAFAPRSPDPLLSALPAVPGTPEISPPEPAAASGTLPSAPVKAYVPELPPETVLPVPCVSPVLDTKAAMASKIC